MEKSTARDLVEAMKRMNEALLSALTDPNFEARQKKKEAMLNNCPLVEWVADMGNRIPFCKQTRNPCNYCSIKGGGES